MPEDGPFGDTRLDARLLAISAALFVNSPDGGCVESVFTLATQSFFLVVLRLVFGITAPGDFNLPFMGCVNLVSDVCINEFRLAKENAYQR